METAAVTRRESMYVFLQYRRLGCLCVCGCTYASNIHNDANTDNDNPRWTKPLGKQTLHNWATPLLQQFSLIVQCVLVMKQMS